MSQELVAINRQFGQEVGPEFMITNPNFHALGTTSRSLDNFETQYRGPNAPPQVGYDLAGSTLILSFYDEQGTTKFDLKAIELPVAVGVALQFTLDEFKEATAQHQTIVDEYAAKFGEKAEEPKTIVEHYYCYTLQPVS